MRRFDRRHPPPSPKMPAVRPRGEFVAAPKRPARIWITPGNGRWLPWLLTILLAAVGGWTLHRSLIGDDFQRADALREQLLAANDAEADSLLASLGDLDAAGAPALAEALGGASPLVAKQALQQLNVLLERWKFLPAPDSSRRVAVLARALAQSVNHIPAERLPAVRRLASRLVAWPLDSQVVDAGQVLADSEIVLRRPMSQAALEAAPRAADSLTSLATNPGIGDTALLQPTAETPKKPPREKPAPLARRQLPADVAALRPSPGKADPLPIALEGGKYAAEPRQLAAPRARPISQGQADGSVNEPRRLANSDNDDEGADQEEPPKLAELKDVAVMQLLHSLDLTLALAAEKELHRRGYRSAHLPLAKSLSSPDPRVRLKLAEALPRLRGIDPRPWLKHLTEDSNETVSTAATNILKTGQAADSATRRE